MRRRTIAKLGLCTGGIILAGYSGVAKAQLAVTGNLSTTAVTYGSNVPGTGALATQTINTTFGDNLNSTGNTSGSELDASYGVVENNYLYLFIAGNIQNNGNTVQVWIDDGRSGGQNVLSAATGAGNMNKMNGSTFSPGFNATYALELNATKATNVNNGTFFVDQYNLVGNTATFLGPFGLTGGVGTSTEAGSTETALAVGVNNTNIAGITGSSGTGTAATAADAQAVSTGIELGIPLATLGNPTGPIEVLADINGNGDSGPSDQWLPGLAVGSPNVKASTSPYFYQGASGVGFNFSTLSNEWFTVPNAVLANGLWLPAGGGNWSDSTKWSNAAVPTNAGDSATFSSATASSTITVDGHFSVGTLSFNNANSYTIAALAGDGLTMDGGVSGVAAISDFGGVHYISAPLTLNSTTTVTCENHGDQMYISGNISGAGGLTVSNSGAFNSTLSLLQLSGTNTYMGPTYIERGELQLDSAGALPTGTALSISAASPHGVLDLNGFGATVSSLTATSAGAAIINSDTIAGTTTLTYAGSIANPSTFPGSISDSSLTGGNATALAVTSGSLTMTSPNSYGGGTTVSNGATIVFASTSLTGTAYPSGGNAINNGSMIIGDTGTQVTAAAISGSGTTTVSSSVTFSALSLNQAGGLVNNGSTTILTGGIVGNVSGAGTLTVAGGTLALAQNSGVSSQGSLVINGGSTLDIGNNALIINYGSGPDPISSIVSMIANGYAGGAWTGTGITSSNAQTNGHSYGIGYADFADNGNPAGLSSGQIEIAYTLLGDANLDYKVNGTDFTLMATNFNDAVTNGWDEGDFDYSNTVNGSDFLLLAGNFNQFASQSGVTAADLAVLDDFAAANGISLTSVPEPASVAGIVLAGVGVLSRRRSRRNRA